MLAGASLSMSRPCRSDVVAFLSSCSSAAMSAASLSIAPVNELRRRKRGRGAGVGDIGDQVALR